MQGVVDVFPRYLLELIRREDAPAAEYVLGKLDLSPKAHLIAAVRSKFVTINKNSNRF